MPRSPAELTVLRSVKGGVPLHQGQHAEVLALIAAGLMHVTPKYDLSDKCPYRLTPDGEAALKEKP